MENPTFETEGGNDEVALTHDPIARPTLRSISTRTLVANLDAVELVEELIVKRKRSFR
jgi:hypothetical protein